MVINDSPPKYFSKPGSAEAHSSSNCRTCVVGMSTDDLETLARFSTEVCASKVPMAHASGDLLKAYDVTLPMTGAVMPTADRVSYVIDTNGDIVMVHADMDYKDHVAKTLEAVQRLAR